MVHKRQQEGVHCELQLLGQFLFSFSSCLALAMAILATKSCACLSFSFNFSSFILSRTSWLCFSSSSSSWSSSSLSSSLISSSETLFTGILGSCSVFFSAGQQYFGHSLAHTILHTDGQPYDRGWGAMSRAIAADFEQHCGGHSVVHFFRHDPEHETEDCSRSW